MPSNETASKEIQIFIDGSWVRLLTELDIIWIIEKVKEALERSEDVPDLSKRET